MDTRRQRNDKIVQEAKRTFPLTPGKETEQDVRIKAVNKIIDFAATVSEMNKSNEEEKEKWRKFFIRAFSVLFVISLIAVVGLSFYGELSDVQLGIFVSGLIAEIVAIIILMVKYSCNNMYLETFKTITDGLIKYLIETKEDKTTEKKNDSPE